MTIETWPNSPRIKDAFDRLSKIAEGKEIVDLLTSLGVELIIDTSYPQSATTTVSMSVKNREYTYGKMSIKFGDLPDGNLIQAIVHEAQHIRQHIAQLVNPYVVVPDDQMKMLHRCLEADAQTVATDIAFKLKFAGDDTPWLAAQQVGYADMCEAYEDAYNNDPCSIETGMAMRAAFDAWFSSDDRLKSYDQDTENVHIPFIKTLMDTNPEHGLRKGSLRNEWYKAIGRVAQRPFNYLKKSAAKDISAPYYKRFLPK